MNFEDFACIAEKYFDMGDSIVEAYKNILGQLNRSASPCEYENIVEIFRSLFHYCNVSEIDVGDALDSARDRFVRDPILENN